ncbi:ribosomal-processing cysteine protease Prp [Salinispira pacifica]|uniref:Ribosomal processing cysteine protease Prp n=1 Tax=Salinispira pacifica TaxID=1307761 RepID=V5WGS6_9SPIO|nr:ribosomal-processing cysteine protease Prp [Salinispira pacifica]AHC14835.1 hypothetical protein L21SP2_1438 [Salinispira pacifica]
MIRCIVEADNGMLRVLHSSGHGDVDNRDARVSISCAAVSTLLRTAGVLLETSEQVMIELKKFQPGEIDLRVKHVDEKAEQWLRGLTDMLIRGLEDVQRDFPAQVQLSQSPKY